MGRARTDRAPGYASAAAKAAAWTCTAVGIGCGSGETNLPTTNTTIDDRIPIAASYLDRSYRDNGGLLVADGPDGYPVRDGAGIDRMVVEARRFYDTLGAPGAQPRVLDYADPFTGLLGGARTTAPLTFDEWKTTFGFPAPQPGETRQAWRDRTGVVIYYNENELGLGRELGCAEFPDGTTADGAQLTGIACFVTNYGAAFSDMHNSLRVAAAGEPMKNTVAISYRPSLGPEYETQFYVY